MPLSRNDYKLDIKSCREIQIDLFGDKVYFFADACFFIALKDKKDFYHSVSKDIYNKLEKKRLINGFENFYITDYIVMEVFKNLFDQISYRDMMRFYYEKLKKCQIQKIVYPDAVDKAIEDCIQPYCNWEQPVYGMGIIDATSLKVMYENDIRYVISFDHHFINEPLICTINNAEIVESIPKLEQSSPKSKKPRKNNKVI